MNNVILVQTHDVIVNRYLPLAIANVWLYANKDHYIKENYTLKDVIIDKVNPELYIKSLKYEPHIVMFSLYLWNEKHSKSFAKTLKKHYPKCKIIVGGPSVPLNDNNFFKKNPYFDIAVLGEGEVALQEILKNNCDIISAPNVFCKNGPFPKKINRHKNLEDIPSPIQTGFYDKIMEKYNRIDKNISWAILYETMRGCPYHCSFCDLGQDYHNKFALFNIERVYKDIDWMSEKKIEYVSVVDSNWGILERDLDISKYVIYKKVQTGYPAHWDVSFAKTNYDRIFKIGLENQLKNTNLFKGVTFAYQSTDKDVLSAINRFNIDPQKAKELITKFQQHHIPTYSELVFPLPMDNAYTLQKSIQDIIDLGQKDYLMVHTTGMYPNAPISQPHIIKKFKIKKRACKTSSEFLSNKIDKQWLDKENILVSTKTLSEKNHIKVLTICRLMITLYYFGWAHYIIEYLSKKTGKKQFDVFMEIFNFSIKNKNNILYKEYKISHQSYKNFIKGKGDFGRLLKDKEKFWEYSSATSVVLYQNREEWFNFLKNCLTNHFKLSKTLSRELVKFNDYSHFDYQKIYPIKTKFNKDIIKTLTGMSTDTIEFNHYDSQTKFTNYKFLEKAYHWQRKNRYWKCDIQKN